MSTTTNKTNNHLPSIHSRNGNVNGSQPSSARHMTSSSSSSARTPPARVQSSRASAIVEYMSPQYSLTATSTANEADNVELAQLKQKLRQQQLRLANPSLTPRRPQDALALVVNPVAGQNYAARPYHRITPREMWQPSFSNDKDVAELADRLQRSEERIETRMREMENEWAHRALFSAASSRGGAPEKDDAQRTRESGLITDATGDTQVATNPAVVEAAPVFNPSGRPGSGKAGGKPMAGGRPGSGPRMARPGSGGTSPHRPGSGGKPFSSSRPNSASRNSTIPDVADGDAVFMPSFQIEHPDGSREEPNVLEVSRSLTHNPKRDTKDRSSSEVAHLDIPQALRRRTSSVKVSQGTIAMLAMLDRNPDIVLPAPKESGFERQGDILSSLHILKQDLFEAAFTRRDLVGVMSGAPYFRMVPKFHIGGVAQAHMHGIRTAVNELRKAQFNGAPIVWVNLREEPIVYLNGKSHIIRSRDDPLKPQIIPNISGERIAKIEEKLKREILKEADLNKGNICVHHESANGIIDEQWECVEAEDLLTLEEVFSKINEHGLAIEYRRRPITQGAIPMGHDFQYVVDVCQEFPESAIIFNCQTGRGRSSMMMLVASIVRFYQMCSQDINADVTLLRIDGKANSYRTLQKLISLMPEGALHERRIAVLMELSDKIYSVADHINAALKSGDTNNEKSRMRLSQYAYLLMFSCYCEQYFWLGTTTMTFPQWIDDFQELKVLVNNITAARNMPTSLAEERITTPVDFVETEEVSHWVRHRKGHVLGANMILRSVPKDIVDGPITSVPGVLALRQLAADVPLFTCGRVSESGREDLLYNIRSGFPEVRQITWVSLRAEPMVFINHVSYSLLDYSALQHETGEMIGTMHVSRERLEEIEERLLKDVNMEASMNDGYIIVHRLKQDGTSEAQKLQVNSAMTPKTIMQEFSETAGIHYVRIPVPYFGTLLPSDIDPLVSFFQDLFDREVADGETEAVVLNDADGTIRATIALNIATIVRASRRAKLRDIRTAKELHSLLRVDDDRQFTLSTGRCYHGMEEEETLPEEYGELQVASVALQMVAAGTLLKLAEAVVDLGGAGAKWNLLHAIDIAKSKLSPNEKNTPAVLAVVELVRQYLLVLLTAAFVDEERRGNIKPNRKFSEWIEELSEIQNILDRLDERPIHAIKYVDRRNLMASTVNDRAVERRSGDVLTANFAMKADHFPGCQKKGLRPALCGAPNFRKVDNINVFGAAIPTILGVHNILSVLGASDSSLVAFGNEQNDEEMWLGYASPRIFDANFKPNELDRPLSGTVVWVNLREEPIIYVGDRPFVFRDMQQPYVNVELTGIESHKVELVENTLKADILREAQLYDGNFLVHDEGKPGELVGFWEVANEHTVKTVREVYDEAAEQGCSVKFLRLPVTDEQSPELKDFDMLVEHLLPEIVSSLSRDEPTSFVFNCQMGRGRTTTGMVVCSLLIGEVVPDYYQFLDAKYPQLFAPTDSELSKGNYTCIMQLKSVLSDGRESKKKLDLVLEACSRMQNLRTAVEAFAQQVNSPDTTEEMRARAHHHGVHYLQRYFDLIAFASYLNEEYDRSTGKLNKSFAEWMAERPELTSLHNSAALS